MLCLIVLPLTYFEESALNVKIAQYLHAVAHPGIDMPGVAACTGVNRI
jgi:hypothetical protein